MPRTPRASLVPGIHSQVPRNASTVPNHKGVAPRNGPENPSDESVVSRTLCCPASFESLVLCFRRQRHGTNTHWGRHPPQRTAKSLDMSSVSRVFATAPSQIRPWCLIRESSKGFAKYCHAQKRPKGHYRRTSRRGFPCNSFVTSTSEPKR